MEALQMWPIREGARRQGSSRVAPKQTLQIATLLGDNILRRRLCKVSRQERWWRWMDS